MDPLNPKQWARSRRAHRFAEKRNVRKAEPNGHTIRKVCDVDRFHGGTMCKMSPIENVQTEFEDRLGFCLSTDCTYSLNKHRRWEVVDDCIQNSRADEVWRLPVSSRIAGPQPTDWLRRDGQHTAKERAVIGYFDMDSLQENFQEKFGKHVHREEQQHPWLIDALLPPRNVTTPRIQVRSLSSSSRCVSNTIVPRARVENFDEGAYWAPRIDRVEGDDGSDFLEVDCGGYHRIEAVSTRGRPLLRRAKDGYRAAQGWPREFVRKYKLWFKRERFGSWRLYPDVLVGNGDPEIEVAHVLTDPDGQTVGLRARFLRFQPLSYSEHGWEGNKAMRIGVYGEPANMDLDHVVALEYANARKTISKKKRRHTEKKKKERQKREQTFDEAIVEQKKYSAMRDDIDAVRKTDVDWRLFTTKNPRMRRRDVSAAIIRVSFTRQGSCIWGRKVRGRTLEETVVLSTSTNKR